MPGYCLRNCSNCCWSISVFIRTCKIILIFAKCELILVFKWIYRQINVLANKSSSELIWNPSWDCGSSKFPKSNAQFHFRLHHKMFSQIDFVLSIHQKVVLFLESRAYSGRRILDLMVEELKHFVEAYKLIKRNKT